MSRGKVARGTEVKVIGGAGGGCYVWPATSSGSGARAHFCYWPVVTLCTVSFL